MVFTAYTIGGLLGIRYGIGQHVVSIEEGNISYLPKALMFWWLCEVFYAITTTLVRCSVAVLLLRIMERKIHRIIIYTTMILVVAYSLFYIFLAIFQCNPPGYFWEQYEGATGSCIAPAVFADATYAHIAVSATADWMLGLLPIWLVWDLKMNIRTKVSTGMVMSLGLV